jgi:hypothetical protein
MDSFPRTKANLELASLALPPQPAFHSAWSSFFLAKWAAACSSPQSRAQPQGSRDIVSSGRTLALQRASDHISIGPLAELSEAPIEAKSRIEPSGAPRSTTLGRAPPRVTAGCAGSLSRKPNISTFSPPSRTRISSPSARRSSTLNRTPLKRGDNPRRISPGQLRAPEEHPDRGRRERRVGVCGLIWRTGCLGAWSSRKNCRCSARRKGAGLRAGGRPRHTVRVN